MAFRQFELQVAAVQLLVMLDSLCVIADILTLSRVSSCANTVHNDRDPGRVLMKGPMVHTVPSAYEYSSAPLSW